MTHLSFVAPAFLLFLSACSTSSILAPPEHAWIQDHPLSILQIADAPQTARFVLVAKKSDSYTFAVVSDQSSKSILPASEPRQVDRPYSDYSVQQIAFKNLKPDVQYVLRVSGQDGHVVDERKFSTFNPEAKTARIIVASCMNDALVAEQMAIWPELLSKRPHLLLMIGDNVYADLRNSKWIKMNAEELWSRYVETRLSLLIFHTPELVPTLATWDDHDYGSNNQDQRFFLKPDATETFKAFYAQTKSGPGVSSQIDAFGLRWILTDNRSFRSPNFYTKTSNQNLYPPFFDASIPETHFGKDQTSWIVSSIRDAKKPSILISGDKIFTADRFFESFEGNHPNDFKHFVDTLKTLPSPVFFISGDKHIAMIDRVPRSRLGYDSYELTTSPLHAQIFPKLNDSAVSPDNIKILTDHYNYGLLEPLETSSRALKIRLTVLALGYKTLYEQTLTIKK